MVSVWFMHDPGDVIRQTSPDILAIEECPFYIYHKWDICCRSSRWIPANKQTTSDRRTAHRGTVGIPCSYTQPDSAWIEGASWLSLIPFWLLGNYRIFRTSHFFSWSCSSPFHNCMSWLQKYFNQVPVRPNRAEQQALRIIRHPVRHSSNADTS